ncbi:MAG: carotenoid biosynthesis protein [Cytophagaceae bacterium]|nr:carotenoid biosynthesis protein [Cytophagaceae bacterium]
MLSQKSTEPGVTVNQDKKFYLLSAVVVIFHLVGLVGLISPWKDLFLLTTPLHLLLLAGLLVYQHTEKNGKYFFFMGFTAIIGFSLEVIGVHSGLIFGPYHYGQGLGWKLAGVPVVIGVNWFLLTTCFLSFTHSTKEPINRSLAVALFMTLFDVILEPVAIAMDFWKWDTLAIPLQNYLSWFLISFGMAYLGTQLQLSFHNRLAAVIMACLLVFFLSLNLILYV